MDITLIQKFYCNCYAETIFAVANENISAIRDMLNTIPGGLFCTKVYKTDNVFNFEMNGIKIKATRLNRYRVFIDIYNDTFELSEAEQLVSTLMKRNAFPDSDKMLNIDFIRTWYNAMSALPRNANMNSMLGYMKLFLRDAE